MSAYLGRHLATPTPQSEPFDSRQVPNSAGGHSYPVDDWTRLDRFLILGSEGGSYYASERKLTKSNAEAVARCIAQDGLRTVRRIVEISDSGRAPKNDPALFALAMASAAEDVKTRTAALDALPEVARIGTHLLHFVDYATKLRGWGRAFKRAVAKWYTERPVDAVAYQLAKYRQRDGWAQRDVMRLAHPKPKSPEQGTAFSFALDQATVAEPLHERLVGFQAAQGAKTPRDTARLISQYRLTREMVKTEHLSSPEVWEALLEEMPLTAMIRNLGVMSKVGLLTPLSQAEKLVRERLEDVDRLRKSRVHPIQVLSATVVYGSGQGARGKGAWTPSQVILGGLEEAFHASFGMIQPTGKNFYLGLDVSGSMGMGEIAGVPGLTPRVASAVMAMVTARTEGSYVMRAFADGMRDVRITAKDSLGTVVATTSHLPFGGTDCALPMLDAAQDKLPVDVFVIYTDSETWYGHIHPVQALREFRQRMGIPAKLVVVGMVANEFTIADPEDGGMLDVVGFDSAAPALIGDFARG